MDFLGVVVGLALGAAVTVAILRARGRASLVLAALGGVAGIGVVVSVLRADAFTRPFGMVYVLLGAALSVVAAAPRLRPGVGSARWLGVGLGAAVVAGMLLVGLGADATLGLVFAPAVKARVSSGMVTGLLGGALCGVTVAWFRGVG